MQLNPLALFGIAAGIAALILDNAEDKARVVNAEYKRTGRKSGATTRKINHAIEEVLKRHRFAKIGKTVQPAKRFQATDYRDYHTMYVVYETTSEEFIKHYETYFINRYENQLDNKHEKSTGRVCKVKDKYYLYVVVAD